MATVPYTLPIVGYIPNLPYKLYMEHFEKTNNWIDIAIERAGDEDIWQKFLKRVFNQLQITSDITDISISFAEPATEEDKKIIPGYGEFSGTVSWTSCSLTKEQMRILESEVATIFLTDETEEKEWWGDELCWMYECHMFPNTDDYHEMISS